MTPGKFPPTHPLRSWSEAATERIPQGTRSRPCQPKTEIAALNGDALTYNEGSGALVIDQGVGASVSDVDSPNFDGGTLTVSIMAGGAPAEDVLGIRNEGMAAGQIGVAGADVSFGGVIFGTFAGGSGGADLVVTFDPDATPAAVSALLRNITYNNTDAATPTAGMPFACAASTS